MKDSDSSEVESLRVVSSDDDATAETLVAMSPRDVTSPPATTCDGVGGPGGAPPLIHAQAPPSAFSPPAHPLSHPVIKTAPYRGPAPVPPLKDQHLAVVQRADAKLRKRVNRAMDYVTSAMFIDDDGVPVEGPRDKLGRPEGWSAVRYNVAKDARKPLKQQPGYIASLQRIHDSYKREDAARKAAPELNVSVHGDIHVHMRNDSAARYEVIDVTAEGDED